MPNGQTKQFKREIVFTKLPLSGALSYKDLFQMFPADLKGMPTTKTAHKHHPQILEFDCARSYPWTLCYGYCSLVNCNNFNDYLSCDDFVPGDQNIPPDKD